MQSYQLWEILTRLCVIQPYSVIILKCQLSRLDEQTTIFNFDIRTGPCITKLTLHHKIITISTLHIMRHHVIHITNDEILHDCSNPLSLTTMSLVWLFSAFPFSVCLHHFYHILPTQTWHVMALTNNVRYRNLCSFLFVWCLGVEWIWFDCRFW